MNFGEERELVPLGAGFDVVRRGYSPSQVNEHLERLDGDLKMLASDRDAAISQADDLTRQLETNRSEMDELREKVERLSQPPTTMEGLSERLQRMLRLAQDEASETRARAEAEAAHIRAKAEADAGAMRTRYDQQLGDLDKRRTEMEQEHRLLMESARKEAAAITDRAKQKRDLLDAEAEERRTKVDEDFEIAMATRRTESMRVLAEQEAASKSESEKRLKSAAAEAKATRERIAKEQAEHKADVEKRHRESVEDANRRKQESISEANARIAEATAEAERRVKEATELANHRINYAAERVEALRELRGTIAAQIASARSAITEADGLLAEATTVASRRDAPQHQVPKDAAALTEDSGAKSASKE